MSPFLLKILLLVLLVMVVCPQTSKGEFEQWCIADSQATDAELQAAMDYTCGEGGADCSKIQENQSCYIPNTLKDHASFAFNSYYQKFKHIGASCYFHSAAMTTEKDPSHGACQYDYNP
ncbi:major pollen allergen Ole e 10-like [Rutidosis leptorrhynchoides]|uniref:major pollen allergen Ole e 10-like n=1 Tax=Rutidosis leptorrhynchoides TaxID=125765 RepID=UPI003A9A30FF